MSNTTSSGLLDVLFPPPADARLSTVHAPETRTATLAVLAAPCVALVALTVLAWCGGGAGRRRIGGGAGPSSTACARVAEALGHAAHGVALGLLLVRVWSVLVACGASGWLGGALRSDAAVVAALGGVVTHALLHANASSAWVARSLWLWDVAFAAALAVLDALMREACGACAIPLAAAAWLVASSAAWLVLAHPRLWRVADGGAWWCRCGGRRPAVFWHRSRATLIPPQRDPRRARGPSASRKSSKDGSSAPGTRALVLPPFVAGD